MRVMTSPLRSVWDAPAATPPPPRRVWRDWALVAALPVVVVVEGLLRPDLTQQALWIVVLVALVPTLLWRRTRPLEMVAIAFAVALVPTIVTGRESQLVSGSYLLILVYALMRWGSGRAMIVGSAIVVASGAVSLAIGPTVLSDLIGAPVVLVAVSAIGLAVRWRGAARARELDRIKLVEREQLARDLHDTVAHHVSAIAIQAQAGTAVAATDPAAAARVLQVIEGEASRTLDEMRSIVRMLRRERGDGPAVEHEPGPAIGDLRELAGAPSGGPDVDVQLEGDLDAVPPTVAAAVYRMGQEAVTNARRHARNAALVHVLVRVDEAGVRLDVHDDGDPAASAAPGYGLTGMRERAALLGGSCEAGPAPDRGWTVSALLPRAGWSA